MLCTLTTGRKASAGMQKQTSASTDESESDSCSKGNNVNSFGETKTSQYRRPPGEKKLLDEREKIPTRRSRRIKEIITAKSQVEKVSISLHNMQYS